MNFTSAFGATVLAAGILLSPPASAQALLPPHEITTSVMSMGLEPVGPPVRRGARYIVQAVDQRGRDVAVVADGLTGRVLRVRPMGYDDASPRFSDRTYAPAYREYPSEYRTPRTSRLQPAEPGEPRVILAPRDGAPQAPARAPAATKLPPPKPVTQAQSAPATPPAAKPPADEALSADAKPPAEAQPVGAKTGAELPSSSNDTAAAMPPAQGLD